MYVSRGEILRAWKISYITARSAYKLLSIVHSYDYVVVIALTLDGANYNNIWTDLLLAVSWIM